MDAVKRLRGTWDWTLGFSLMGLGAVLLAVAILATRDARYVSDQLSYLISGGLGGLLLLGAGSTLVISAGLGDEGRKLDRVEAVFPLRSQGVPGPSTAVLLRRGRMIAGAGMLLAVAFLLVAWLRASGEADPNSGFEAVGIGIVGLLIGGLVAAMSTLWLKRTVQLRKSRLLAPWALADMARGISRPSPTAPVSAGKVVLAPGLTRFHASGCASLTGLAAHEVEPGDIPEGLEPCELCHPEASGQPAGAPSALS